MAYSAEHEILSALLRCRYLPGSWDKKFPTQINLKTLSPLQRWFLYHNGYKYRKQIGNAKLEGVCKAWLAENPKPLSRREAEKILKATLLQ